MSEGDKQMDNVLRAGFGKAPAKREEKAEQEKRVGDMSTSELVAELAVSVDRLADLRDELELRVEPADEEDGKDEEDRPDA